MVNKLSSKYPCTITPTPSQNISDHSSSSIVEDICSECDSYKYPIIHYPIYSNYNTMMTETGEEDLKRNGKLMLPEQIMDSVNSGEMNEFYPSAFAPATFWSLHRMQQQRNPYEIEEPKKHKKGSQSGVMAIGLMGVSLGMAGLIAYAIVQVPTLREKIYKYPSLLSGDVSTTSFVSGIFTPGEVVYGFELFGIVSLALAGILVNGLLMFGASKRAASFYIPWLVFQTLFITLLLLAFLLVAIFASPIKMKGFSAIPLVISAASVFCWIKVFNGYKALHRQRSYLMYSTMASVSEMQKFHERFQNHSLPRKLQDHQSVTTSTYKSYASSEKSEE